MSRYVVALALVACSSPPAKPIAQPAPPPIDSKPDPKLVEAPPKPEPPEDPYLWLEDVTAEKSLDWARARNATSKGELEAVASFAPSRDRVRSILDSKDKIPYVNKSGAYYYNFWTDAQHKKGLLRRTSLAEYKKKEPKWETVLDVDALGEKEHEAWVYKGSTCLYPKYERCMLSLSKGGGDATVTREFDMVTKTFLPEAKAFFVPEAKSRVAYKDADTLYIGTDFGPGTMTTSGYPRLAKEWKRGTKLADAKLVFEGKDTDVSVSANREWDNGKPIDWVWRRPSFFAAEGRLIAPDGTLTLIDVPLDADVRLWRGQLLIQLRTAWTVGDKTFAKGALLATSLADFMAGKRVLAQLYEPAPTNSLAAISVFKSGVVLNLLEDVKNRLYIHKLENGKWTSKPFAAPAAGESKDTVTVNSVDPFGETDDYWMMTTDLVTPATLSYGNLAGKPAPIKQSPSFFDAKGLEVTQHFAKSKDGTRVPYFQVARRDLALDGNNPTILTGYGGFEVAQTSRYSAVSGAMWSEKGGVNVIANIRGGGEYGPAWHQAALRHDRQRAYDDFIAIAEDLIARRVTKPARLGIIGGSNGGLLMGVMLTERPDLFGAIVCSVPLLDMKRYHKLLAGASWMEEYGDPDKPDDWAALAKFSPYQNVHAETKYPRTLFTSSTRDDRVHPGHARKMVARMLEQKHDVLYYENIEGGHGGAADNEQAAFMQAMIWTFFGKQLGLR